MFVNWKLSCFVGRLRSLNADVPFHVIPSSMSQNFFDDVRRKVLAGK